MSLVTVAVVVAALSNEAVTKRSHVLSSTYPFAPSQELFEVLAKEAVLSLLFSFTMPNCSLY